MLLIGNDENVIGGHPAKEIYISIVHCVGFTEDHQTCLFAAVYLQLRCAGAPRHEAIGFSF